ncbi:MAG: MBL fold metallo-hydrolase [Armatimonadota bacterium]|nr:MBL fold metallo-hydrolase [bacterium]MCS7308697.1 MBL fold metallo-hydrolase [Armatimonadota bacterium]MDW8104507.1 MBL fold metallo-hydrolase [Armatimonadota bacterium]MDW8289192.1 MBL fold metallo-hydrolase [Armatimonadota bacterium]
MKILFLGTSAAEGVPGIFCGCEVCQVARQRGGKNLRTRSSIFIDGVLKIDLPPDTLHHVLTYGLDLSRLHHLLITHTHEDHLALHELGYLLPGFAQRELPLKVYGSADFARALGNASETVRRALEVHVLQPFTPYEIERYTVVPVLAYHREEEECFNYLVSDGTKTVLYMCDTGWYREATWRYLAGVRLDAVIAECTKGFVEAPYDTHLGLNDVLQLKERLRAMGTAHAQTRWVVTHFSHNGRPLHEELEAFCRPHGVEVAYDGWEMALSP